MYTQLTIHTIDDAYLKIITYIINNKIIYINNHSTLRTASSSSNIISDKLFSL